MELWINSKIQSENDTDVNANSGVTKRRDSREEKESLLGSSPVRKSRMAEPRFLRPLFVGCVLHSLVHLDDWVGIRSILVHDGGNSIFDNL